MWFLVKLPQHVQQGFYAVVVQLAEGVGLVGAQAQAVGVGGGGGEVGGGQGVGAQQQRQALGQAGPQLGKCGGVERRAGQHVQVLGLGHQLGGQAACHPQRAGEPIGHRQLQGAPGKGLGGGGPVEFQPQPVLAQPGGKRGGLGQVFAQLHDQKTARKPLEKRLYGAFRELVQVPALQGKAQVVGAPGGAGAGVVQVGQVVQF